MSRVDADTTGSNLLNRGWQISAFLTATFDRIFVTSMPPKPGDVGKSIPIMNVHPSSSLNVDPSSNLNPPEPMISAPFAPNAIYELKIGSVNLSIRS
jgi:hypothetical protein